MSLHWHRVRRMIFLWAVGFGSVSSPVPGNRLIQLKPNNAFFVLKQNAYSKIGSHWHDVLHWDFLKCAFFLTRFSTDMSAWLLCCSHAPALAALRSELHIVWWVPHTFDILECLSLELKYSFLKNPKSPVFGKRHLPYGNKEKWGCSAWRREGCMDTSEHLPASEGATGKLKRDCSSRTVVTRQGRMTSNWNRGNLG